MWIRPDMCRYMLKVQSLRGWPRRMHHIFLVLARSLSRTWQRSGVGHDLKGRLPHYRGDWTEGWHTGYRILAPATYIFLASFIPALAFGAQLSISTDNTVSGVQVLLATGICGIIQAVVGGQPLLIVGVAEPIVILYGYLYTFASNQGGLGPNLFLAWAAWCCVWAALFLIVVTVLGASRLIDRFTAFAGEMFGMLIAVLFMHAAVQGVVDEFREPQHAYSSTEEPPAVGTDAVAPWPLVNGLWGLILALGVLLTALGVRTAEGWRLGTQSMRIFATEYGVPLCVLVWTFISFALKGVPSGVPRRLIIPNLWTSTGFWTMAEDMGSMDGKYVAMALLPGLLIAILFYFDHHVSSQMAQTADLQLVKPPAYGYDMLLLAAMTVLCGLLGLPPVNGVLPQSPMHSKALFDHHRRTTTSLLLKAHRTGAAQGTTDASSRLLLAARATNKGTGDALEAWMEANPGQLPPRHMLQSFVAAGVTEQRVSGLLQSLLVAGCAAASPILRKIPTAVLWGYFAFMALESLPGNTLWERMILPVTDPAYYRVARGADLSKTPYLQGVPIRTVMVFTAIQFAFLAGVYAITKYTGVVGIIFPVPILIMVLIRRWALPRLFSSAHLNALDPLPASTSNARHAESDDVLPVEANGGTVHSNHESLADARLPAQPALDDTP